MQQVSHAGRRRMLGWIARVLTILPFMGTAQASGRMKPTPAVTVGPFYPPDPMGLPFLGARALSPLPQGNDLTAGVGGRRAEGERMLLQGRVMNTAGQPLAGARVEIWQVDARGHYAVETGADRDPGFSGYGVQHADASGRYAFTTIRPRGYGSYGGLIKRAAHLHLRVAWQDGRRSPPKSGSRASRATSATRSSAGSPTRNCATACWSVWSRASRACRWALSMLYCPTPEERR